MKPVLVVDDEPAVADAVCATLERHGFATLSAATLAEARRRAPESDLVLLDLGLPDGDGLDACRELADRAPLIIISARDDESDRVAALELGADDYLAKPFSTRELVARCRSVLRRAGHWQRQAVVTAGDIEIDFDRFEVRRGGEGIPLTTKEIEVLMRVAQRGGDLVRREELAAEVWGASLDSVTRSLDVHVSSLRRKLGPGPDGQGYLDTVHGLGYRLRP
jgi:DNA-binding response OmpR family regulator